MNIIAIDDEPLALELIKSFCSRIESISLQSTFTKVNEAMSYLKSNSVDLILLDVNMPQLSGIEFYKNTDQKTMVIFTTAYSEHALEGFNLNAIDYILKPYSFERFEQAIKKALEYYEFIHRKNETELKFIYVKADYSFNKIALDDILYIEAFADFLKIYLLNNMTITARLTMKGMMAKLPESKFLRVHRSFIVPINKIISLQGNICKIEERNIPIGVSYKDDLKKYWTS